MFNPENSTLSNDLKPFLIYTRHLDKQQNGTWRPEAFVGFSRALRTSGFLAALPAEELKSLLYLLSFVTANGYITPSVLQLAEAFHLSQFKARRRMERLRQITWQGKPLVGYRRFESGLDAFVPHTGLFTMEEEQATTSEPPSAPPYRVASREEIIAHSRRMYAHPRAEVEAMIAQQLRPVSEPERIPPDFTEEQRQVMHHLRRSGLTVEQAIPLVARYDLARIERQIAWLPYRQAHNPTGFLVAAIERDYEAPRGLPQPIPDAETPPELEPDNAAPPTPTPEELNNE